MRPLVKIFPDAVLKKLHVYNAVLFRDAYLSTEILYRLRRVPSSAQPRDCRHPGIVPTAYESLGNQPHEISLAKNRVTEVKPRELYLAGVVYAELGDKPVVKRPVILKLKSTERMGDALNGITLSVRPVIHRIDRPGILGAGMRLSHYPVHDRVAHVHVARRHVYFRPQHVLSLVKIPASHRLEES